ncbi:putative aminopeptidase npepl1 [Geranomyces michiganensis]|nr:putative aminopeptidase npepl1 [Geranomyces michiganensis]
MSNTTLYYGPAKKNVSAVLTIGDRATLAPTNTDLWKVLGDDAKDSIDALVDSKTDVVTSFKKSGDARVQHTFAHLGKERTRHTGAIRSDLVHDLVAAQTPKEGDVRIVLALENQEQVMAAAAAVARAFPLYNKKSAAQKLKPRTVNVEVSAPGGVTEEQYRKIGNIADSIRLAARLTDMPCSELNTTTYIAEVKEAIKDIPTIKSEIISGEELATRGFGGIYGVGKAAEEPPALVVLTYTPEKKTIENKPVFVGKGIVYDTGGLSLKSGTGMCGMKGDMGGSAACFGAILAAAKNNYGGSLTAVLCLAENAIGHKAQRPDDIVTMYSGKTVELNNTDAEGRLVLGDGVAYATRDLKATHVIDIATLTGAQLMNTGKKHAAILSRDEDFERAVYAAGQTSGDWCFAIIYAPEVLKKEFDSKFADMRNSVGDRANAQCSCAGLFIESHLEEGWTGKWVHVDIAGPAHKDQRATGFGVALLLAALEKL